MAMGHSGKKGGRGAGAGKGAYWRPKRSQGPLWGAHGSLATREEIPQSGKKGDGGAGSGRGRGKKYQLWRAKGRSSGRGSDMGGYRKVPVPPPPPDQEEEEYVQPPPPPSPLQGKGWGKTRFNVFGKSTGWSSRPASPRSSSASHEAWSEWKTKGKGSKPWRGKATSAESERAPGQHYQETEEEPRRKKGKGKGFSRSQRRGRSAGAAGDDDARTYHVDKRSHSAGSQWGASAWQAPPSAETHARVGRLPKRHKKADMEAVEPGELQTSANDKDEEEQLRMCRDRLGLQETPRQVEVAVSATREIRELLDEYTKDPERAQRDIQDVLWAEKKLTCSILPPGMRSTLHANDVVEGKVEWASELSLTKGIFPPEEAKAWWNVLQDDAPHMDIWGSGKRSNRPLTAWLTRMGCTCCYSYKHNPAYPQPMPLSYKALGRLTASLGIQGVAGAPKAANVNLYENGRQFLDWHADDEPIFGAEDEATTIVSVSFGTKRTFSWKPKKIYKEHLASGKVVLEAGDVLVMDGRFQSLFVHRVEPDESEEPRLNITWRTIRHHEENCPEAV